MIWLSFLMIYRILIPLACSDIISRDFKLDSQKICKTGCSKIVCYPNTLISIDSIEKISSSEESKCNPNDSQYSAQEFNCHFKFIENHIFKTCSNTLSCEICPDKIELRVVEQNTFCTSEFDFRINYRCIPSFIKNDNVCAHSYLDLSCSDGMDEKLVILNVTILSKIKATSDDLIGCPLNKKTQSRLFRECHTYDQTNQAVSKCSFRDKCSIGPNGFTPPQCENMHMKISHACVPSAALNYYNKKKKASEQQVISLHASETKEENGSWFTKQKWKILGISSSIMVVMSVLISLSCFFIRRKRDKHNCHINSPKDNLFNKLGQVKFSPPPSSIDKVNMEFEDNIESPDMYNSNSDVDEINMRSIYSSKLPCALSYNSPYCIPAPTINTCQYFSPLMSPSHINMLDMPPIQQASSGNLTSSTNSSHGTPRGTKSSGIFSMNDASFELSHQV